MARIQAPPRNFHLLSLIVEDVEPSALVRMASRDPASHCRFRREARYRFDSPDRSFGVMYATFDLATAFAETVLRDKPRHSDDVILDYHDLESRVVIELKRGPDDRPLRLIKLYDEGLAAAHTDNQISARDHYPTTQRWARRFFTRIRLPRTASSICRDTWVRGNRWRCSIAVVLPWRRER